MGNLGGTMTSGGHMRLYDRLPLGQNKAVVVARVGLRWLVLGVSDDQIMYEVYSYEHDGLCYGLTVMQPVCVNGECNVTRGHFHENLDCDEIYCGMGGEGLLLLMDEDYHCHAEKVKCGSVHYIDGHLAHRLVNTGNTEFKVQCMWPSHAGHDYKRVEDHPFTVRVYKENGELKVEEE